MSSIFQQNEGTGGSSTGDKGQPERAGGNAQDLGRPGAWLIQNGA